MHIPERLKSRKFWMAVAGIVGLALLAWAGQISWTEAVNRMLPIVVGYTAIEGAIDYASARKPDQAAVVTNTQNVRE